MVQLYKVSWARFAHKRIYAVKFTLRFKTQLYVFYFIDLDTET